MRRKSTKAAGPPPPPPPAETSSRDRAALAAAYQAGLITAWKRDAERGYRLTVGGQDDYVEIAQLPAYLQKLARPA
jgi:hypothetical protein